MKDENGKIILYSKGADSILFARLNEAKSKIMDKTWSTWSHLEEFGKIGLRTLVLTEKEVDERYYQKWAQKYQVNLIFFKNLTIKYFFDTLKILFLD